MSFGWRARWAALLCGIHGCATSPPPPQATRAPTPPAASAATSAAAPAATSAPTGTLAERLAARVRELLPRARVETRGDSEVRIWPSGAGGENDGLRVYLDNLKRECEVEARCTAGIERFAHAIAEQGDEKLALEAVLPTLKSERYVRDVENQLNQLGEPKRLLVTPVVDDLRLVLVLDLPTRTRFLSDDDLPKLGLSLEQLAARALENLRRRPGNFRAQRVAPGLYGLTARDGYDSAMFLLHDDWQPLKSKVKGELVVAPVSRDMVFVTGDQEKEALQALGRVLENERQSPSAAYPITTQAYRWHARGWSPLPLP